jgi:hypothetical protein
MEGNPPAVVAPHRFVVLKIPHRPCQIDIAREEGKGPDVGIERTSASARWQDLESSKGSIEALGVQERFLFDPLRDYLDPPLRGSA